MIPGLGAKHSALGVLSERENNTSKLQRPRRQEAPKTDSRDEVS